MSTTCRLKMCFYFAIFLSICDAKIKSDSREKIELQDQILEAIKDSEVLKDWKEKLDVLVKKDNEVKLEGNKKKSVITAKEREMLSSFIDAYIGENDIPVSTELVLSIVDRSQKFANPNLPQLFVQLGPVIETLSSISKNTKETVKIVEKHAHILDSKSNTKEALQSFTEKLKSELVHITPAPDASKQKKSSKAKKTKKDAGLDMSDYLKMGANLLKEGNAKKILDMVSKQGDISSLLGMASGEGGLSSLLNMVSKQGGLEAVLKMMSGKEGGMQSMLKLLPSLLKSGKFKDQALAFLNNALKGTPWAAMVQPMVQDVLAGQYGQTIMEEGFQMLDIFVNSESGKRIIEAAPKLVASKDVDSVISILSKEAEWNWNMFFAKVDNTEYKNMMLDEVSSFIINTYDDLQAPSPLMMKVIQGINHLLETMNLPLFDINTPVKSLSAIVSQAVKMMTGTILDIEPYVEAASDAVQKALENHLKERRFDQLSLDEKKAFITLTLDKEVIEPIQAVWMAFSHVGSSSPECAQHLFCLVNKREFSSGLGESRRQLTKVASFGAAWALSRNKGKISMDGLVNKDRYWVLQKAVRSGAKGQDCQANFPVMPRNRDKCTLFSWQKGGEDRDDIDKDMERGDNNDGQNDVKINLNHVEL